MPKNYDLILFDMDGTIVNSDDAIACGFLELYKIFKAPNPKSYKELYYFSGPPIEKTLANEFPDYDLQLLLDTWHEIALKIYQEKLTTYPDQHEVLWALKNAGYRLGVVTNKITASSYRSIEICHLEGLFETLICRDTVANPKPNKEGIELAMKNMNVTDRSGVIYIGDNTIDYMTAANAGIDCILVTWGPREVEKNLPNTRYVSSFKELKELFIDD